jgi:hypothetical protein
LLPLNATYSASVINSVMFFCPFDYQAMGVPFKNITNPVTLLLVSLSTQ